MSEGKKNDQGKLRLELVPVEAINAIARAMTYGANKYGDWNWSKGIAHTRLFGAALRHMWAYFRGENIDAESGNHHLDHALASLAMLRASVDNSLGEDDRPVYMHRKVTSVVEADIPIEPVYLKRQASRFTNIGVNPIYLEDLTINSGEAWIADHNGVRKV